MKKIIKKPCSGKTTELIKKSAETGMYIVTANRLMAELTAKKAADMGLKIPYPISFNDFLDARKNIILQSSFVDKVLIDDADMCLQSIFGRIEIDTITMDE